MRRISPSILRFVALAIALGVALVSGEAWAQITTSGPSVGGINGTVLRCEPPAGNSCEGNQSADSTNENPHPGGVLVNDINFEDCSADLHYQFSLSILSPSTSYQLEAWAGTQDCSQLANRQTSATSVCWPVAPFQAATVNPTTLSVRMQDIVSGVFTTTHPVTYVESTDPNVCQLQTQTGATNVTLYLFFVDGGSNPVGTVQQYPITVDMRAGDVQGSIAAGVGDTVLIVSFPPTTDPDTQGWNVYCDPAPSHETATETVPVDAPTNNGNCPAQVPDSSAASIEDAAGDALFTPADASEDAASTGAPQNDDAGGNACGVPLNDSGIPSPGGCATSSVLVPGGGQALTSTVDEAGTTFFEEAGTSVYDEAGVGITGGNMVEGFQYSQPYTSMYKCGYGGVSSTSINVEGLKDGYYYNIAVAAVDALGNVGPLSNVVCGEPVPVADFWRVYYDDGGRAGGGFCSLQGVGVPAGTSGLGVLMVASIVAVIRKRRKS
jgi:hypothetical protein